MSDKRIPATTVKDFIEHLQECDPDAHIRLPGNNMGIPRFVEQKPAYYDGGYWYYDFEEEQYVYTRSGKPKVDIYVEDVEDIVYMLDGDMEKIKKEFRYEDERGRENFWKRVEKIADEVRRWEEQSVRDFTFYVLEKLKEGYKVVQSIDDEIGHYNVMWYHKEGDTRRSRFKYNEKDGGGNLRQGDCGAVIKSGLFEPVEKPEEGLIYWELVV